jgi:hypothetical protein
MHSRTDHTGTLFDCSLIIYKQAAHAQGNVRLPGAVQHNRRFLSEVNMTVRVVPGSHGIGMRLGARGTAVVVLGFTGPTRPAFTAGVRIDDELVAVDGQNLQGDCNYAERLLVSRRGPTAVALTLRRHHGYEIAALARQGA